MERGQGRSQPRRLAAAVQDLGSDQKLQQYLQTYFGRHHERRVGVSLRMLRRRRGMGLVGLSKALRKPHVLATTARQVRGPFGKTAKSDEVGRRFLHR